MTTDGDGETFPKLVGIAYRSKMAFGDFRARDLFRWAIPRVRLPGTWIYMPRIHASTLLASKQQFTN